MWDLRQDRQKTRTCIPGLSSWLVFKGKQIDPDHLQTVKKSNVLITILSWNYASSRWCLGELVPMMVCKNSRGHVVLPIIYEVEPKDAKHQLGLLGERFWSRKKRVDVKVVDEWEKALPEIRSLKGWDSEKDVDRYEGDLVNLVIIKVLIELKKAFEVVFTDHCIENVLALPSLYGMGGIGKIACAKVIYNKLADQYDSSSYHI